jgi:hypothetical protein
MLNKKLTDFIGFIVQNPMGGILESDELTFLAEIDAEGCHFVAEIGVLLPP